MSKRNNIPNPNKLSIEELNFIKNTETPLQLNTPSVKKEVEGFKKVLISMPGFFYKELDQYLKNNPTEGNRSGFIVRVVAEYIKSKNFL